MVAVPLLLNLITLFVFSHLLNEEHLDTAREARAKEFNTLVNTLCAHALDPVLISLRYATNPSDQKLAESYTRARQEIERTMERLRLFKPLDASEELNMDHLQLLHQRVFKLLDAMKASVDQGRDGLLLVKEIEVQYELEMLSRQYMAELEQQLERSFLKQEEYHKSRETLKRTLKFVIFFGFGANVVMSTLLAFFFTNTISTRISRLRSNIQALEKSAELPIDTMTGNDEIVELNKAYYQMSQALQDGRNRERTFIDNARDIICTINKKLIVTNISPSSEQLWGYKPDELIGRPISELIIEEEATTFNALANLDKRSDASLEFENTIRHKSGGAVNTLWSVFWSHSENASFCVAHDITARKASEDFLKESEARVRSVIEGLPICLLTITESGRIETANRKAQELLKLRVDQLVGQQVSSFVPLKDCTDAEIVSALNERGLFHSGEINCVDGDNCTVPIELLLTDLNIRGRREFLVVLVNRFEHHQIEKARAELVNMVSHDLRTPISSVLATMDLLLVGVLGTIHSEDAIEINKCIKELERLVFMVNGLLDIEKIKSGVFSLDREISSLKDIVERALEASRTMITCEAIELVDEITDCELICDGQRLSAAMVYLINEAVSRLSTGGKVFIKAFPENDEAEFMVTIPATSKQQQTNESVSGDRKSTGNKIGVIISSGIVKKHGGSLGITDEKEFITWFRVPLPCEQSEEEN